LGAGVELRRGHAGNGGAVAVAKINQAVAATTRGHPSWSANSGFIHNAADRDPYDERPADKVGIDPGLGGTAYLWCR
jgi:hypothetical protein